MASVRINGYKGSIYPEGKGYTGVLDLGFKADGSRNRPKRKGHTKADVEAKLTRLAESLAKGVQAVSEHTVLQVVTDYVDHLARTGKAPGTIRRYRGLIRKHISRIGAIKLCDLKPARVSAWLVVISADLASEPLRQVHGLLSRAIDRAMVHEMVDRNVSRIVENIAGEADGRESKSFTPEQVQMILRKASAEIPPCRFGAYVVLALTSGLRVDELNGLLWSGLDLEAGTVSVVRAARHHGKTKTKESVRTLALGRIAIRSLKIWKAIQEREFAAFGAQVTAESAVFTRPDGSDYTPKTARPEFREVLKAAGIENVNAWTLRETRTTFVSIMSHNDIPREQIADMCGHTVKTLERHYRKVLKPVHRGGAEVINAVFNVA